MNFNELQLRLDFFLNLNFLYSKIQYFCISLLLYNIQIYIYRIDVEQNESGFSEISSNRIYQIYINQIKIFFFFHKINLFSMVFSPPTFKTATPTSRTQLKLQLMREQLQEQERREAEFRQNLQQQRPTAAPPRPVPSTSLSTIGVDVPPQVLQVCSYLVIAHPFSFIAVSRSPSFLSSHKYFSCTYKCNDTSNYLYAYLSLLFRSLLSYQIYIRERFIHKLLKVTQNCGVVFLFAQKYRSKEHVIYK